MLRELVPTRFERAPDTAATWRGRDPVVSLHRDLDRFFDDFRRSFGLPEASWDRGLSGVLSPQIDVVEADGQVRVEAELPGLSEKDIEVRYNDGVLTITGSKSSETADSEGRWHVRERAYGQFRRDIPLGGNVQEDGIDATYKNGILTVTLPKSEDSADTVKRIPVHG